MLGAKLKLVADLRDLRCRSVAYQCGLEHVFSIIIELIIVTDFLLAHHVHHMDLVEACLLYEDIIRHI